MAESVVKTMKVTNTPATDLALTNLAYCSPSDLHHFFVPDTTTDLYLANIADVFVLSVSGHERISDGTIALNAVQRRHARVSTDDFVTLTRFVPPENFNLTLLALELEFVKKGTKNEEVDAVILSAQLKKKFIHQVLTVGQRATFEYHGINYIFTVNQAVTQGQDQVNGIERGMISNDTYFVFEASNATGIKITNQREAASSKIFKGKEFNLQALGIGGLKEEFNTIFRRAFASRILPPHIRNRLGKKHVKGMLLYGPPGTGKTLMARQIGKMLSGKEPKIVNGPEVLSKFVGETEKNVRDLFADAENDQKNLGDDSGLHVIIFDEIDAICKSRGSSRDSTGVHDSIVNQLLTKIDGVEALNNVLLIGMTNRKDMLDEALLRPGRLEIHIEISLPDNNGRLEILQIHTKLIKENSFLAPDVNLQMLAAQTKNYSGAELEGVVKSATSYALNRHLSMDDLNKPVDEENVKVTMEDFLQAVKEVKAVVGASPEDLGIYRPNGFVDCDRQNLIYERVMFLVEGVKMIDKREPPVTCLLQGPKGSGKTALAATVGMDSEFPYVKMVSAETMKGLQENAKAAQIAKVFEDAYKSPLSIVILDNIEWLLEYSPFGPRYSNTILLTLKIFLNQLPPEGSKLLVLGTTSKLTFLENVGLSESFSVTYTVPLLKTEDANKVLEQLNVFSEDDIEEASKALNDIPIKQLYRVIKMAAPRDPKKEKLNIAHFLQAVKEVKAVFGDSPEDLGICRPNGFVDCDRQNLIYEVMFLVEQVKMIDKRKPPVTCLLQGPRGSGKTALAATVGMDSEFPYVKMVSAATMSGLQENAKAAQIAKVFEDAYKSPLSIVILDSIERLLEYSAFGQRYSNTILQTLMNFLDRLPPEGSNLLVLGTTSELTFLKNVGLSESFSVTYTVPLLKTEDAKKVLEQLNVFSEDDIEEASKALNDIPIKQLYNVIEMAASRDPKKEKLNITHFLDCLQKVSQAKTSEL